jgi:hypothetical protein
VEAGVFIGVRLARSDFPLLRREDLSQFGKLRLGDALGGQRRDRGLDETAELDHVGERVTARDEPGERTSQIVGRRLPDEGPAAGSRLDDPEKLERSQRFADGCAGDLELFGELSLGRKLIARAKIALLEETLDLLDDALVEAAAADRLDDGQGGPPAVPVRWPDQSRGEVRTKAPTSSNGVGRSPPPQGRVDQPLPSFT